MNIMLPYLFRIMESIETSDINEEIVKLIEERYLKISHNKSSLVKYIYALTAFFLFMLKRL